MVIPISKFFRPISTEIEGPHRPILTSYPLTAGPISQGSRIGGRHYNYARFWKEFRSSAELIGVLSVPITDIIGDRPTFVAPDGKQLGRNIRIKANNFWIENRVKETLKAILYDMFVTGDAYGFILKPKLNEIKQMAEALVTQYVKQHPGKINHLQFKEMYIKAMQDEDLKSPKKFDYVASSTMQINSNNYDITAYTQTIKGISKQFSPEEIIHFRFMTIDGMVEGFSPVEALASEIALLWLVKGNMLAYMENGGSPQKIFKLPGELANSPNHQYLVDTLTKYKKVINRNGNLVFTGEIEVDDLTGSPKDLEYKDLALYIASNIALAYNVPVTRLPYLIGQAAAKGDAGGMSEAGYWNMISEKQDMIEDLMNYQLFQKLGFHIRLNRKYKQDEVREAQILSQNASSITQIQSIGKTYKKVPTLGKINQIIGFCDDDWEEAPEDMFEIDNPFNNQNLLDNSTVMKEPDKLKKDNTKRNVANRPENKDVSMPGS